MDWSRFPVNDKLQTWLENILKSRIAKSKTLSLDGCPWKLAAGHKVMYVRETYEQLQKLMKAVDGDVILTGDPGTGKSFMTPIIIVDHIQAHESAEILWQYADKTQFAYLSKERCFFTTDKSILEHFNHNDNETSQLYVVDRLAASNTSCKCIRVLSPNIEMLKKQSRLAMARNFTLDHWTKEELLTGLKEMKMDTKAAKDKVEKMVEKWGPVARMALNPLWDTSDFRDMDLALQKTSKSTIDALAKHFIPIYASSTLFHRVVNSDYQATRLKFASSYVFQEVVKKLQKDSLWDLEDLISAAEDEEAVGNFVASKIYEEMTYFNMMREENLNFEKLNKAKIHSAPYSIEAPVEKKMVKGTAVNLAEEEVLFVPKARNHPFFDSFMAPNHFFQITSARVHDANGDGFVKSCNDLKIKEPNIIFVVPPYRRRTFRFAGVTPCSKANDEKKSQELQKKLNVVILVLTNTSNFSRAKMRLGEAEKDQIPPEEVHDDLQEAESDEGSSPEGKAKKRGREQDDSFQESASDEERLSKARKMIGNFKKAKQEEKLSSLTKLDLQLMCKLTGKPISGSWGDLAERMK